MTTVTHVLLRPLGVRDYEDFCILNADEKVMKYFPAALTCEQSQQLLDRVVSHFDRHGFGLWAVEIDGRLAGISGLLHSSFNTPMGPHVEIGWRFMPWAWGRGNATSAAREALRRGFEEFDIREVFSYTTTSNTPSENVMKRLGMHRRADLDFDHPNTPGWWGQRHIVYRIERP